MSTEKAAALNSAVEAWRAGNHRAIAELKRRRMAEFEAEAEELRRTIGASFLSVLDVGGSRTDILFALKDAGIPAGNVTVNNYIEQAQAELGE